MNIQELIVAGRGVVAGVIAVAEPGRLEARLEDGGLCACDVLTSAGESAPRYQAGDRVLVAVDPERGGRGIVIGAVVPYGPAPAAAPADDGVRLIEAREIVVRAGTRLTLRVGDGSIVISEDGAIAIQGKTIASRARAVHRIRGAAVQIN